MIKNLIYGTYLKTNIITLAHQKGGTGKSTLAWNLAIEFNKKYKKYGYKKFIFIDLDNQESITMTNRLRMRYGHEPLEIIRFTDDERNKLENFINSVDSDSLVIIDSGGYDADLNRIAIIASDFVITPVSSDYMEIFGLQKFRNILEELSLIKKEIVKVNVLLNKIDPKLKDFKDIIDFINDIKNFNLMKTIIRFRSDYKHSIGYGISVEELDKKSKATKEIKMLIKEIERKANLYDKKKK
jgi:chromosome partitioning protein